LTCVTVVVETTLPATGGRPGVGPDVIAPLITTLEGEPLSDAGLEPGNPATVEMDDAPRVGLIPDPVEMVLCGGLDKFVERLMISFP
jgi:hypothetical protein